MIQQKGWSWMIILGLFYCGLGVLAFQVSSQVSDVRALYAGTDLESEFEGNDWVSWEDTDQGVIASRVHPLPGYKPNDRGFVRKGDRILELDYHKITMAESVEDITSAARPQKTWVLSLQREDPISFQKETLQIIVLNGFRLTFSFNDVVPYWHIIGWLVGIGAFVALVMMAILMPVLRTQRDKALSLLGVVLSALLFFLLQLFRHIYLIIENDLTATGFEKGFILSYVILLSAYAIFYFRFRSGLRNVLFVLPGLAVGVFLLYYVVDILYVSQDLKYFHGLVERLMSGYFFLHLGGAVFLHLADTPRTSWRPSHWGVLGVGILSLAGSSYALVPGTEHWIHPEHVFFLQMLLHFFPLVNATFLQLQFGKVSLVVTQTIQYIVAIVVSVVFYLLIIQLFDYFNFGINYRRILEFITFVLGMIGFRMLYLANESRLQKYFVTSKQEKETRFKNFIARIPQYTNAELLRTDTLSELRRFFQTELVEFWWSGTPEHQGASYADAQHYRQVYEVLNQKTANWSKTKEIEQLTLESHLEDFLLDQAYHLVCPITVDEDNFALLMLGRKKRSVYNLGDMEMISQLIQQIQLTLNVLQLVTREKELIQQTYEANLTALRSQINPHFLFNTLNSIGELVHESADLAEAAVEKLAFIFRYTLKKSSQNFVPLSEEMGLISTYLDLEKIRFGERLETHISVAQDIRDVQIPAFILQTLVENCIKHGIAKILHKGLVSIEARKEERWLVCDVYDNGPGIDLTRIYKSTGLSNSIARLENLYDQKNLLQFENTGDGTLVRMRIPLDQTPVTGLKE